MGQCSTSRQSSDHLLHLLDDGSHPLPHAHLAARRGTVLKVIEEVMKLLNDIEVHTHVRTSIIILHAI